MNNENIPTAMNTDNPTDAAISLGCYNSSTRQKLSLLKVAIAERFPSSAWILDEAMDTITALSAENKKLLAENERMRGPVTIYKHGFGPSDGESAIAGDTNHG